MCVLLEVGVHFSAPSARRPRQKSEKNSGSMNKNNPRILTEQLKIHNNKESSSSIKYPQSLLKTLKLFFDKIHLFSFPCNLTFSRSEEKQNSKLNKNHHRQEKAKEALSRKKRNQG